MQSKATNVKDYLAELPADRRAAIEKVHNVILANLDKDFKEGMQYGMICYAVPHSVYPPGYHCDPKQPLPYAGLASQKNYMSLYIMSSYGNESSENWLREEFAKAGKKLDMGKCCIRFKKLDDLPLDVIGKAIKRVTAAEYIKFYESNIKGQPRSGAKKATKTAGKAIKAAKPATKKTSKKAPTKNAVQKTAKKSRSK